MYLNLILLFFLTLSSFFAEDQPEFKGGHKNLNSFIYSNLIYPEFSSENCLQGSVMVSFKVNQQGKIYESSIYRGFGTDLDIEALRVVRLTSGKWIVPANHDTLTAMVLPVNFSLRDSRCNGRTKDEINAAISAYRARAGLNSAIYNFYDKKSQGKYDPADEARIEIIKSQLGYDAKYIDKLLKQAQRKLKQGDNEGACEDFQTIRLLGSDKSASFIAQNCK